MQLAVAAAMLHHVDRVPSRLADDRVDLVRAVLDERADRHPAAAVVGAEKRPLQPQLVLKPRFSSARLFVELFVRQAFLGQPSSLAVEPFLDAECLQLRLVDRIDGQQPARHVADRDGDQHQIDAPAEAQRIGSSGMRSVMACR